ncbi:MAG: glycosyltransferase [Acidobacteria bacterium]|nr:glycosyltransferase [Acidobacteriota bacterium]MCW5948143.1 glycosyltransferase [Pyrinomonadaceae bacterium]
MPKALYICYFGVREPLVRTQVLPYLREIVKDGVEMHLLTFEPENWSSEDADAEVRSLAEQGITWHRRRYHKWPSVPATLFDILVGIFSVRSLTKRFDFDILHARVHLPALMASIARRLMRRKPKILFDIRGFFPEEYTDAGIWPENGWLYRTAKSIERWLLKEVDGFVVLTEKGRDLLFPESKGLGLDRHGRPVAVIPCCVDAKRFEAVQDSTQSELRRKLGLEDRLVIAYVGSFGGWYLSEEMYEFLKTAKEMDPRAFAMILTQRGLESVRHRMNDIGFENGDFLVRQVSPSEVPDFLSAADLSISFILQCYSKIGASPTKIAEYLACGLPIVSGPGVGDIDELIDTDKVGVLLKDFSSEAYWTAFEEICRVIEEPNIKEKCFESARRRFDLDHVGGPAYRALYQTLLNEK